MQYGPQSLAAGGPVGSGRRCSGSAGQRVQPGRPTHQVRYRRRRSSNPQVFRREIMFARSTGHLLRGRRGQRRTGTGTPARPGQQLADLGTGAAPARPRRARDRPGPARARPVREAPAAGTTRWAPAPPVCATCSSPSTWTGPRSSDTPSAVAASGAVRLPVPPTHPAPRAGGQRRAGPRVIIGNPHNRR